MVNAMSVTSTSSCEATLPAEGAEYTVGSMFAGIGGICIAFKNAGADVIWANELDKFACMTYRKNLGSDYLVEGDIKDLDVNTVPNVDILTAGFPCQAFSIAGYKKGFRDERGALFFEILRIMDEKHPRVVFLENVKNLVGHDNGQTFENILRCLKDRGYFAYHQVLNTMEYGDIPQNRERTYIVAFKDKRDAEKFSFPEAVPLTKSIRDIIDASSQKDELFYYKKDWLHYGELKKIMKNENTVYQWRRTYVRENKSDVCPTLTANMGTGGHNVPLIIDDFGYRKLTPSECLKFQGFPSDFRFPDISNGNMYKQAGNSVSVPVVQRIAENILDVMKKTDSGM
jgi:DNA (cytosine-5)-methyltransferase 1